MVTVNQIKYMLNDIALYTQGDNIVNYNIFYLYKFQLNPNCDIAFITQSRGGAEAKGNRNNIT